MKPSLPTTLLLSLTHTLYLSCAQCWKVKSTARKKKATLNVKLVLLIWSCFSLLFPSVEGEYVPMAGDHVTYKECPIPPKRSKVQAVEVIITHLAPGTKHHRWEDPDGWSPPQLMDQKKKQQISQPLSLCLAQVEHYFVLLFLATEWTHIISEVLR